MGPILTVKLECEVQEGSNVEVSSRASTWTVDVTDLEFAFNVTLLALAALREARDRSTR